MNQSLQHNQSAIIIKESIPKIIIIENSVYEFTIQCLIHLLHVGIAQYNISWTINIALNKMV